MYFMKGLIEFKIWNFFFSEFHYTSFLCFLIHLTTSLNDTTSPKNFGYKFKSGRTPAQNRGPRWRHVSLKWGTTINLCRIRLLFALNALIAFRAIFLICCFDHLLIGDRVKKQPGILTARKVKGFPLCRLHPKLLHIPRYVSWNRKFSNSDFSRNSLFLGLRFMLPPTGWKRQDSETCIPCLRANILAVLTPIRMFCDIVYCCFPIINA